MGVILDCESEVNESVEKMIIVYVTINKTKLSTN